MCIINTIYTVRDAWSTLIETLINISASAIFQHWNSTENYEALLQHDYLPGLKECLPAPEEWNKCLGGLLVTASWTVFAQITRPRYIPTYNPGLSG